MVRGMNTENLKITIVLENGEIYERKDVTNQLFGANERLVSCWVDDKVRIFPLDRVKFIDLISED